MEAAAPPAAVLGDVVMEPSDPHRGRGHVIRSFQRRHARRNCALQVSLKPGEREAPTGAASEGRALGCKRWMAKVGGTGTSQHIYWHPRGQVAQATTGVKQQAREEQGLGT